MEAPLQVSAAGVTAGIDGALRVAALLRGAAAQRIRLDIQYAPEPPFDCGLPHKAPPEILSKAREATYGLATARLATAKRLAAGLGVRVDD